MFVLYTKDFANYLYDIYIRKKNCTGKTLNVFDSRQQQQQQQQQQQRQQQQQQ